jgi:hypothetical protein
MTINDALNLAIRSLEISAMGDNRYGIAAEVLREMLTELEANALTASGFDFEDELCP